MKNNILAPTILIAGLFTSCASVLGLKSISSHYDPFNNQTTFTTRDIYLIERTIPPYTLKLTSSKACAGELADCESLFINLIFFSSSYPGFNHFVSFVADSDTIRLGETRRIGSDAMNMSEANIATTMLQPGELIDVISVSAETFEKMSNASRLTGMLGSQNFELTFKERTPWRLLLQENMLEELQPQTKKE